MLTLPKYTRLCGTVAIDRLFERDAASWCVAYPLRAVWREAAHATLPDSLDHGCIRFLITIPKKKLRHAVDRVTMRRRIREAYRLSRHRYESLLPSGTLVDVAFVYTSSQLSSYSNIEKSVHKILSRLTTPFLPLTSGSNE